MVPCYNYTYTISAMFCMAISGVMRRFRMLLLQLQLQFSRTFHGVDIWDGEDGNLQCSDLEFPSGKKMSSV